MNNVILEKTCNAFYPRATVGLLDIGSTILAAAFKRSQGGLWVGGKLVAAPEGIYFEPDLLNFVVQSDVPPVQIHVSEIGNVRLESGWFTDIVVIEHARGEFKFRCYGAEQVVQTLMPYYCRRPAY